MLRDTRIKWYIHKHFRCQTKVLISGRPLIQPAEKRFVFLCCYCLAQVRTNAWATNSSCEFSLGLNEWINDLCFDKVRKRLTYISSVSLNFKSGIWRSYDWNQSLNCTGLRWVSRRRKKHLIKDGSRSDLKKGIEMQLNISLYISEMWPIEVGPHTFKFNIVHIGAHESLQFFISPYNPRQRLWSIASMLWTFPIRKVFFLTSSGHRPNERRTKLLSSLEALTRWCYFTLPKWLCCFLIESVAIDVGITA